MTPRYLLCRVRSLCRVMVIAFLGMSIPTLSISAQEPRLSDDETQWHFGFELFQVLFEERGLKTLSSVEEALNQPEESIIVSLGSSSSRQLYRMSKLQSFLDRGGSLLIASDEWLVIPGIGIFHPGPVSAQNQAERYLGYTDCIQVTSVDWTEEMMQDVQTIITNRSGWFTVQPRGRLDWKPLANLPSNCSPIASNEQAILALGFDHRYPDAAILALADTSLLTNSMLWHGDNAVLAIRISDRLCQKGKQQVVMIADGEVLQSFQSRRPSEAAQGIPMPEVRPPETDREKLLRLANAVLKKVADSNVVNEALRQRPRNMPKESYLIILLTLLLTAILFWLLGVIFRKSYPMLARQTFLPNFSASQLKSRARMSANDFRGPAGILARDFCREITGSISSQDWQCYLSEKRKADPTMGLHPSDQQKLIAVIDLASRGSQYPISHQDLFRLGRTIRELRESLATRK